MPPLKLELPPLPGKPARCEEVKVAWRYLAGAHKSVSALFDALHVLRVQEQQAKNKGARGRLSQDQQDLLRAALGFTSSGLDACLRRLLRDALPALVDGNKLAEKKFKQVTSTKLDEKVPKELREAILNRDTRQMIGLYAADLAHSSLQDTSELTSVRDAIGITHSQLHDNRIDKLDSFFAARNEIVHELDYIESTGRGIPSRRVREQAAVREQCSEVFVLAADLMFTTADNLRRLRASRSKHS
ncbi:MAG TPA: hypothetical protein VLW50_25080 [Streptosporangiaceae bacterium]|nr:hypothetical protein [Streptosporangiaceae bacterium]